MSHRLIVTGFGPFASVTQNPSELLATNCGEQFEILDVSYDGAARYLDNLDRSGFDTLVMLGVNIHARRQRMEFFARNAIGVESDISGQAPSIGPIRSDEPAIRRGTLWQTLDLQKCHATSFPTISFNAGDYLCNFIYYESLRRFPDKRVGFLHIPPFEMLDESTQLARLSGILQEVNLSHRG